MTMLWYKAWLDTRWRFAIGFALLVCGAWLAVFGYPRVARLVGVSPSLDTTTEIGRRLKELVDLSRGYRGYMWTQWFRQTATQMGTLLAVILGSGSLFSYGGGDLYTLSLPASRTRLLWARAGVGCAEILLLAFVPALVIVVMSPAIGERYSVVAALVHATCLFIAGAAFFSLALLLSTSYSDVWRPMLIALAVAFVITLAEFGVPSFGPYSILRLMSGETYFRSGHVPWLGLAASTALSAALLAAAALNLTRRDF